MINHIITGISHTLLWECEGLLAPGYVIIWLSFLLFLLLVRVCVWKIYTLRRSLHRRESKLAVIRITQENSNTSFCYSDFICTYITTQEKEKKLELCAAATVIVTWNLWSITIIRVLHESLSLSVLFCVYFFSFPEIFILVWPPDRVLCVSVCVYTHEMEVLIVCCLFFFRLYLVSFSLW
jgi:hypothetical protein